MQQDISLVDVLIDGFEKNEILRGYHWRTLPLPSEADAIRKFNSLVEEARRWKGEPLRVLDDSSRRLVAWSDIEIRQAGRGIMIRVRAPNFDRWWHDAATWEGDPVGPIFDWLQEEDEEEN
jgi:hypothetical protein